MSESYALTRSEISPLLGERPFPTRVRRTVEQQIQDDIDDDAPKVKRPQLTVLLIAFSVFCLAGQGAISLVPLTKLLEGILCQKYYSVTELSASDIDERLCKVEAIQSQLVWLTGAIQTIEAAIGFLFTLPYGILADRIGRRPVFALTSVGNLLSLSWMIIVIRFWQTIPIYYVLVGPIFNIIGGGENVVTAVIYSTVSSSVSTEDRANSFLRVAIGGHMGSFVGSLLAARMMQVGSPWTPLFTGFGLLALGTSMIIFIPETALGQTQDYEDLDYTPSKVPRGCLGFVHFYLQRGCAHIKDSMAIVGSPSASFVLFAFVTTSPIFFATGPFLAQYISERFDWTFAEAGYLLSIRGIGHIVVFLLVIPGITKVLQSPSLPLRLSPSRKDLVLAQASAILLLVGMLFISTSKIGLVITGQVITTFGDGLAPMCRSVLASMVDPEHASRLYSLISIVQSIGSWMAGPAVALLFSSGMKLGGYWEGLPYWVLSTVCGVVAMLLGFVRLSPRPVTWRT